MADTRTVVLVLSPRAAEAVERRLNGDNSSVDDLLLIEKVIDELRAQRADLAPLDAKAIAERMAKAGAEALEPKHDGFREQAVAL